jgi:hypothetical protein
MRCITSRDELTHIEFFCPNNNKMLSERSRLCISIKRRSALGMAVVALCMYASEVAFTLGATATFWVAYSFIAMKQAEFASYAATTNELNVLFEQLDCSSQHEYAWGAPPSLLDSKGTRPDNADRRFSP